MVKRVFKAFAYREFRLLWTGACISSIGTWMQKLAQSWLVLELSQSPTMLGLDVFLGQIPIFLFSVIGGVVADRFDRRLLLVGSQIVQLTSAFLLAALFATGAVQVWHILTLSFITGFAQAFGGPAYQALIPSLVPAADLPNAIALNSIQFNLARVIGPVLGGLALARLGAAWCFSLNGLSFFAVIVALLSLKAAAPAAAKRGVSWLASLREGLAFIRTHTAMTPLICLAFAMTFLGVPMVDFLPVMVKEVYRRGSDAYTLLLSLSGGGAVLGALVVASLGNVQRKGLLALMTLGVLGLFMTGFALSRSLLLGSVMLFLAGSSLIAAFAMISSLVQLLTPDEMRGRVMSVYNVAFRGGMPLGSFVAGVLIEQSSAPVVLGAYGLALVFMSAAMLARGRRVSAL
jgi:MFS family permease